MNEVLSAEKVLETKGVLAQTVVGVSMRPLLKGRRDTVVIKPVTDRLKKYDVPLYRNGQKLVLHRVIEVRENDYVIRGDNCTECEIVKDEQILGVLTEFYRKNRRFAVSDKCYLIYSKIWVATHFIRAPFMKLKTNARRALSRLYHKIIKKG